MPKHPSIEELGPPALKLAGFQIWIHGRQFPDAVDADDGNWLRVTVHCGSFGASVFANGSILENTDIRRWGRESALLLEGEADSASLDTVEPELSARIDALDPLGHLRLRVEITLPLQAHVFEFEIDQSYLSGLIAQCEAIVRDYPVRGKPREMPGAER